MPPLHRSILEVDTYLVEGVEHQSGCPFLRRREDPSLEPGGERHLLNKSGAACLETRQGLFFVSIGIVGTAQPAASRELSSFNPVR